MELAFFGIFCYTCIIVLKICLFLVGLIMNGTAALSFYGMDGIPWYMFVLAGYTVLSYMLRKMNKYFILVFSIILGLFSGYDSTLGDMFFASRFIVFYPFFVLGEILSPGELVKVMQRKRIRLLGLLVLVAWAVICVLRIDSVNILLPLFTGRIPFGQTFDMWGCLYRGLCYIITLIIGFGVMCVAPQERLPAITHYGSRTLQIYFWHNLIRDVLVNLKIHTIICISPFGKFIWLLLAIACTFVLGGIKLFGYPTNWIVKASRYE